MLASVCQAYVFRKAQDLASLVPLGAAIRLVKGGMNCSGRSGVRSEEHTSELQSRVDLVCRLLLEKKKNTQSKEPDNRKDTIHEMHPMTQTKTLQGRVALIV